jgi:hypothetical protein
MMVNAKRLYVYSVLGAALVLLLWGLTSILRWAGRAVAAALGSRDVIGADVALDELSLAIALVVVALPIWLVHFWLAQQPLRRAPAVAADERASPARATYFFLVLTITGGMALLQSYASVQEVLRLALTDERAWGLAGAVAGLIVFAAAWLGHIWWRRADVLAAPARTAGDWLTRAYLYGGLFILAVLLASWIGSAAAVLLGELVDARAMWESWESWEVAFIGPAAGVVGAAVGWSAQWLIGRWLLRADPPLGPAHRASRTRTGYFLAVVLVCATAALFLLSSSAGQVLAEGLGVWRSEVGSRWMEDVALPLIMVVPFVVLGWWHWRQAMREALAFGGQQRHENVRRSALYGLAFVGLAGVSIGAAWTIQAMLEYAGAAREVSRSAVLRDDLAPALATVLVSLPLWLAAWRLVRHDFATDPASIAGGVPRRAYLLLVSGLAVVALMGSLALIAYQLMRLLLGVDVDESDSWPVAVAMAAGAVLAYHLWRLRLDARLVAALPATVAPTDEAEPALRTLETIDIRAPAGLDLEALNETLRQGLPEGVEMHVVGDPEVRH